MNLPVDIGAPAAALAPEWERLEYLGYCLSRNRRGEPVEPDELDRLRDLQRQVEAIRRSDGPWARALGVELAPLEWDLLACVVAPDIEPRVGWLYHSLQPGSHSNYPSRALVQELLALAPDQAGLLHRALQPGSALTAQRLLESAGDDPYRSLRPSPWVGPRLLGQQTRAPAPPGALPVARAAGWDDLVLPAATLRLLREFLLWLRHRDTVERDWGGERVGGPVALFAGPPGTGKTLAASVVAGELGWPLYRVDLGRLVSKYIGETEENLNRLFDAAHGQPMVLQFDEADALFAKRGEVREARDRYANMEVSHLLSRIENHCGPCILTTNLRKQMDAAFTRRFQVIVDFPRPDTPSRERLWRLLLPPRAPRAARVDCGALARSVALTGAGIRNAALHAAFLAAEAGRPIDLPDIAAAVWRELGKEGRELNLSELGSLAPHLPEDLHDA